LTLKKTTTLALACFLTIGLIGCGKDSAGTYTPKPPKEAPKFEVDKVDPLTWFPLEVGNQWVYEVAAQLASAQGDQRQGGDEFIFKCVKVEPLPDGSGKLAVMQVFKKDDTTSPADEQVWRIDKTGLYQISVGFAEKRVAFDPPQPVLLFPAKIGTETTWQGIAPIAQSKTPAKQWSKLADYSFVDTGAGKLYAIHIEQYQSWALKDGTPAEQESDNYWAPKVGIINLVQTANTGAALVNTKLFLKQYTIKGTGEKIPSAVEVDKDAFQSDVVKGSLVQMFNQTGPVPLSEPLPPRPKPGAAPTGKKEPAKETSTPATDAKADPAKPEAGTAGTTGSTAQPATGGAPTEPAATTGTPATTGGTGTTPAPTTGQ